MLRGVLLLILFEILVSGKVCAQIIFEDVSEHAGITYTGRSVGASWGDFNGDGRPDLWVGSHGEVPRLYIGVAGGRFDLLPGMSAFQSDNHGAAWADFDNDGDQDLLVLNGSRSGMGSIPNNFLVNESGLFSDQALEYRLSYSFGRGRTPLWFDWNNDGYLDVFLTNDPRADGLAPSALFTRRGDVFDFENTLAGISTNSNNTFAQLGWSHLFERPLLMIQKPNYPEALLFYDGLPFQYAIEQFQFPVIRGIPVVRKAQDVAFRDFDGDGYEDFFITQAHSPRGFELEEGQLSGILEHGQGVEVGVRFTGGGCCVQFSFNPINTIRPDNIFIGLEGNHPESEIFTLSINDINHQGIITHDVGTDLGIYVGYDVNTESWTILSSDPDFFSINYVLTAEQNIISATDINFESSDGAKSDVLFHNFDGQLTNITASANLDTPTACESVVAADFDNDMDIDIYLICRGIVSNSPNRLLVNNGDGTFIDRVGAAGAAGSEVGMGESGAAADFDQDGFIDIFVTNGRGAFPLGIGPDQLFRNMGNNNNWIELDLVGIESNRDGIGARIQVLAGGINQVRLADGGMHRFSQDHARLHFGLANHQVIDEIRITWPSGSRQVLANVAPNQILEISECTMPLLSADVISTERGQTITVDLLANDICLDNTPINLGLGPLSNPASGKLELDESINRVTLIPNTDFSGLVTFPYTVSDARGRDGSAMVSVRVNDSPAAVADTLSGFSGSSIEVDVLANDSGLADGLALIVVSAPPVSGGLAEIINDKLFYYIPEDFIGTDSFEYTITDNDGDSSAAIVTVEVQKAIDSHVTDGGDDASIENRSMVPSADDGGISATDVSSVPVDESEAEANLEKGGGSAMQLFTLLALLIMVPVRSSVSVDR